jgi:hypothetical protein
MVARLRPLTSSGQLYIGRGPPFRRLLQYGFRFPALHRHDNGDRLLLGNPRDLLDRSGWDRRRADQILAHLPSSNVRRSSRPLGCKGVKSGKGFARMLWFQRVQIPGEQRYTKDLHSRISTTNEALPGFASKRQRPSNSGVM